MNFLKRHISWFCSPAQHQIRFGAGFVVAIILVGGYALVFAPPSNFPSGDIVVIGRGASVSEISKQLSDAGIIKYPTVLTLVLRISEASSSVKSGVYLFKFPENTFAVARRLSTGEYGLPPVRVTFPEGVTVLDISKKISEALPLILAKDIIALGKSQGGYLFPDTYLFTLDATAESVVKTMRANFDVKIGPLSEDIKASGHSISDIVTMASLIEKEVRTNENKKIVAGILWNRLKLGMPLQVDAVFGYIFNRDTYSPSFEDLKVDSPYNTYIHTGLPPSPINNPGLESIQAVINPTKTDYLYYLTGSDDKMHYAVTYAGHQANQRKYLH
jgi:UPF0755 protein